MRRVGWLRVCVLVPALLLAVLSGTGWAQLIPLLPPEASEANEDATPQVSRSAQILQSDLAAGRFDELGRVADRLLQSKARNPGGNWKLDSFYAALDPRTATDAAMQEHLAQLDRWIAARPDSMPARVAMAKSLIQWAWIARGSGLADTVTPAMSSLFFERIERTQKVLVDAAKVGTMCPQWYSAMMTVALANGWEHDKMEDLYERAVKFEPGYLSFYRQYANYLLPKWEGSPGDATKVAKAAADHVGGDEGDLIYFEFATVVIKRGNGGIPKKQMDWERIKRGAHALESEYGQSRTTINQFAFMAFQYRDAAAAGPVFAEIGDKWAPGVWKQKANFENAREWAQRGSAATASPAPGD